MNIEEAREEVVRKQRDLRFALDVLGRAAIDAGDAELRRSWYRKTELLEEMEAQ